MVIRGQGQFRGAFGNVERVFEETQLLAEHIAFFAVRVGEKQGNRVFFYVPCFAQAI